MKKEEKEKYPKLRPYRSVISEQSLKSDDTNIHYPKEKVTLMINESRPELLLNLYTIEKTISTLNHNIYFLIQGKRNSELFYGAFEKEVEKIEEKLEKRKEQIFEDFAPFTEEKIRKTADQVFSNVKDYKTTLKEIRKLAKKIYHISERAERLDKIIDPNKTEEEKTLDDWFKALEEVKQGKIDNTIKYLKERGFLLEAANQSA